MTYFRKFALPVFLLLVVQLVNKNPIMAQAAVCDGVTMYAIFNDSIDASVNRASIIAPVNSLTGVVGTPLMTSGGITLSHVYQTGPTKRYYGSASLGVDPVAKRFYANSQMVGSTAKEFFAISTIGAGAQNTIATTPSVSNANVPTGRANGLDDYHFVKMAVNQAGTFIYALGVIRDTALLPSGSPVTANPLIRLTACGAANCSTMILLGYLPSVPVTMSNWHVYNGDMAFDNAGNLYYATVAFEFIGGGGRYTDARLFMIKAADIPTTVGTGTIPMSFIADYNILDSTAMDGIAFDGTGAMFMTTKRFTVAGVTTGLPGGAIQASQLYKTSAAGAATLMPAFTAPATYSIADLASCSFPLTLLATNELVLTGRYTAGNTSLNWTVNDNTNVDHYEVQRSDEGSDFSFTTIARIDPKNTNQGEASYTYNDPQSGYGKTKFYRVREVMNGGMGLYSQVVKIAFNAKISLIGKPAPNPVADHVIVNVQLKSDNGISARLIDQSGRIVYQRSFSGVEGENKLSIDHMLGMAAGIYILELTAGEETVREKLVKQ